MAVAALEYELEALPELEAAHEAHETEWEGESEADRFFGALANLARQGATWVTTPGSPQRRFALWAARQAINRGLPALGRWVGSRIAPPTNGAGAAARRPAAGGTSAGDATGARIGARLAHCLSSLLPQRETEWEFEMQGELNPVRKWYPDAMLEHLGHAAAETASEAEAEALAGAMIPIAAKTVPKAAAVITRATPGLVCGLAGVTRALRRSPATKPLVRVMPAIVRGTAATIARRAAEGRQVTPQAAVRTLAAQTLRVLGNPQQAAQAFRRSQQLDRQFHRIVGVGACPRCHSCGARVR